MEEEKYLDCITFGTIPEDRLLIIEQENGDYYYDIDTIYQDYIANERTEPINIMTTVPFNKNIADRVLTYGKTVSNTIVFKEPEKKPVAITLPKDKKIIHFLARFFKKTKTFPECYLGRVNLYSLLPNNLTYGVEYAFNIKEHETKCDLFRDIYTMIENARNNAENDSEVTEMINFAHLMMKERIKEITEFSILVIECIKNGCWKTLFSELLYAENDALWFIYLSDTIFELFEFRYFPKLFLHNRIKFITLYYKLISMEDDSMFNSVFREQEFLDRFANLISHMTKLIYENSMVSFLFHGGKITLPIVKSRCLQFTKGINQKLQSITNGRFKSGRKVSERNKKQIFSDAKLIFSNYRRELEFFLKFENYCEVFLSDEFEKYFKENVNCDRIGLFCFLAKAISNSQDRIFTFASYSLISII